MVRSCFAMNALATTAWSIHNDKNMVQPMYYSPVTVTIVSQYHFPLPNNNIEHSRLIFHDK